MKLGTKLLLVTLALTVGLTVFVGGFVTVTITQHEKAQALEQIDGAIRRGYFERVQTDQRQVYRIVKLLMEDPHCRSLLQTLSDDEGTAREASVTQLRDEIFGKMIRTEVLALDLTPAFHVLMDPLAAKQTVLVAAGADEALAASLGKIPVEAWPTRQVLGMPIKSGAPVVESELVNAMAPASGARVKEFVYTPQGLFLMFGMPLRASFSPDDPPSFAYFVGFRVTNEWVARTLGAGHGNSGSVVHSWIKVGDRFAAYGSSAKAKGAPGDGATLPEALAAFTYDPVNNPLASDVQVMPLAFSWHGELMVGEALCGMTCIGTTPMIFFASSLDDALVSLRRLQRLIAIIGGFAFVIAWLLCRWIARSIAEPVNLLVAGTQRVSHGDFDHPVQLARQDELGTLAQSFNAMTRGLAQRDFIKDTFGKFVDPSVVEGLLSDPAKLKPGGEVRVQTILFCDLAGFTKISEKLEPQELVKMLNVYLGGAADAVTAERGIVDKFIGDAVMAFWGPPLTQTHADRACRAAFRIAEHAKSLDKLCADLGVSGLTVRVGIATGPVLVGNIGSPNKFNYTVIGDTCNLASRIEGINKVYGTAVLAPWETIAIAIGRESGAVLGAAKCGCDNGFLWRVIDHVRVVGKETPVVLCEVMSLVKQGGSPDAALIKRAGDYASAMAFYEAQKWAAAAAAFGAIAASTGDGPSRELAQRCTAFAADGTPAGWDGAFRMTSK